MSLGGFLSLFIFFTVSAYASSDDDVKLRHSVSITQLKGVLQTFDSASKQGGSIEENETQIAINYAYIYHPMVQFSGGISYEKKRQLEQMMGTTVDNQQTTSVGFELGPIFNILNTYSGKEEIGNAFYLSIIVGFIKYLKPRSDIQTRSLALSLGKRFSLIKKSEIELSYSPHIWIKESRTINSQWRQRTEQGIRLIAFDLFF